MCLLLLRIVINEVTRPRTEAAGSSEASSEAPSSRKTTVNITENRLNAAIAAAKSSPPVGGASENDAVAAGTTPPTTFLSYKDEAENYALQHQVNKLKQHHRRAFELISRALQIDEETGSKDTRQDRMFVFSFFPHGNGSPNHSPPPPPKKNIPFYLSLFYAQFIKSS